MSYDSAAQSRQMEKLEKEKLEKATSQGRLTYKIVLVDIDGSTFSNKVQAYSFEDALIRIRTMYKGYGIQSVEVC